MFSVTSRFVSNEFPDCWETARGSFLNGSDLPRHVGYRIQLKGNALADRYKRHIIFKTQKKGAYSFFEWTAIAQSV